MNVSVVVVTVGRPEAVMRCVDAVAAATLGPAEVIVVDSSAPELSQALDDRYRSAPFPLRHLRVPPMGVSHARNLGATQAVGDWIAFTDDDCVPSPEWLRELVGAVASHDADGATGAVLPLPDDRPGLVAVSSRADPTRRVFGPDNPRPAWEIGTGGNLLLSRTLFERAGGFDTKLGPGGPYRAAEDVDLLDRVMQLGATIVYEPKAVVFHEMKTAGQRLARRYPYGYGLGAMIARRTGPGSASLAASYGRMQLWSVARGVKALSARRIVEPLLAVAGFCVGACRGLIDGRTTRSRSLEDHLPRP
jgi:GT2 family glycosyltransferase